MSPARRSRGAAARLACALCLAAAAGPAWSQDNPGADAAFAPAGAASAPATAASQPANPPPRLSVELRAAATNNGGLDDNGMRQGDFITSVRPALDVTHKGAGFNADVHAAATLIDYARSSQHNGVLPDVRATLGATLVEQWLKVDASGYLRAAESDPFGVRTDDVTAANHRNEWGVVAGPTLQHEFGPETAIVARHQFGVTRAAASTSPTAGGDQGRLDTNLTLVRFERKPTPLGVSAELTRLDNRSTSDLGDSRYTLTTGRVRGTLLVGGVASLGILVGQDRSDYLLSSHVDPLYGAALDWTPGPRTHLELEVEHRYFGESGRLHLEHRTPFLTIAIDARREPLDATSSFGTLGQGVDLRNALDSILTTRFPDPATRAGVVDAIVSSRGLDTRTAGAVNLVGDYPQLQTAAQASLTLLGVRDTLSLSAYALTTRALARDGDPLGGLTSATADNRQRGATLQLEHRLGAQLSAVVLGNWSRIVGLGTSTERSAEQAWRISLLDHLSRRSDLTVGLQWNRFETTAVGQRSFDATLGLVGLSHRF
jgi:uncharacterized protein (PEP-CTERM system associated)